MTAVVFFFQVHQPYRLSPNRAILERVAARCYLPMNRLLGQLIDASDGRFRCALSLSSTVLQQLADWAPAALDSFAELCQRDAVEVLGETSHHSLASCVGGDEFERQVGQHRDDIDRCLGRRPTTFANTELILDEGIARRVESLGYRAILGEGTEKMLGARSPHRVYRPGAGTEIRLLLRDYRLSDDVGFRFPGAIGSAGEFADRLAARGGEEMIGLFLDYETFGEHCPATSGIFEFMRQLPAAVWARGLTFATPGEAATAAVAPPVLPLTRTFSWADRERDLSAWLGNPLQKTAHAALWELREVATDALEQWRRLSSSDHFYYMATKTGSDGYVHDHFSPFAAAYEGFAVYIAALERLRQEISS